MTQHARRCLYAFLLAFLLGLVFLPAGRAQDTPPGGPPPAADQQPTQPEGGDSRISLAALKQEGADLGSTFGQKLQSLLGMAFLVGVCFAFSNNKRRISWRVVAWGLALQIVLGAFVMKTGAGRWLFSGVNDLFNSLIGFTTVGASFLFGSLAKGNNIPVGPPPEGAYPPFAPLLADGSWANAGAYFAFNVLPTIIFFSSLMAVLYHVGVMQWVVKGVAWVMLKTMGTSGAETLSASGNIFVGQTEAPLLVRPFIKTMTESELMAVMTGGFATVAGGVMAAYIGFLNAYFQDIAGHLLSASVMSAPAALVGAKLMIPEPVPEKSETYGELKLDLKKIDINVIDAAARGAGDGLKLALNVGAMLLAFLALIAMLNALLGWMGGFVGHPGVSLEGILGTLLAPVAWLMGVPWEDAGKIGQLIGIKTVLNEFVAYQQLGEMLPTGALKHPRSVVIATYALCGFANFGSIAIQIGGIGGIAPERRSDLAKLGMRAMIAGTIAALMTATVAGLMV